MPASTVDLCTLTDFALGNLTTEESLKVIAELERDPQATRDLEFILKLIAHLENEEKESASAREPEE